MQWKDFLTILDIEEAVLNGQIIRVEKDDPRGTKYVVGGLQSINKRLSKSLDALPVVNAT
ncbi:MAG: DUF4258 domain-containing protein [Myxacorys chilensis ATA2-1-KO14]|jgi:hypothetical protein|nr:DUF4258 domain-containing protein [Myxacorys chilensis ATA2-1-KO14]